MLYPAAIFIEPGKAYGVTLPDIPGCNTAGDTLEEALENVREAVELALEGTGERPVPSGVERWRGKEGYEGVEWVMVHVELSHSLTHNEPKLHSLTGCHQEKVLDNTKKIS